jgi:hypothetical protein
MYSEVTAPGKGSAHGRFQACSRASGSQMSVIEKKLKEETFGPIMGKP